MVIEGHFINRPFTICMDETGNRHPDKKSDSSREGRDWFGFGGIMIWGEHNDDARTLVKDFSTKWRLKYPAHITDMMSERKGFAWLGKLSQSDRDLFWSDWKYVLRGSEAIGIGCVISRPGYAARGYLEKHKDSKWLLCRSAFDITIERATKIARLEDRKLHVVFEQDPAMNSIVVGYFDNLKTNGLEFDPSNSNKYAPLSQAEFNETLGRIEYKPKAHPLLQIADSYIYSIARHKFDRGFHIYRDLRDHRRIADFAVPSGMSRTLGVKYYCFD